MRHIIITVLETTDKERVLSTCVTSSFHIHSFHFHMRYLILLPCILHPHEEIFHSNFWGERINNLKVEAKRALNVIKVIPGYKLERGYFGQ